MAQFSCIQCLHQPPKKEYANYKILQQQIKEKKEKEKEEAQLVRPALSGQSHLQENYFYLLFLM